jgi:hypothetical protein
LTAEIPEFWGWWAATDRRSRRATLLEISGDHFCIRGLPLIAPFAALREEGALS